MSQLTADTNGPLAKDNITLPADAWKMASTVFLAIGVIGIGMTIAGATYAGLRHALASYHVGFIAVLAISLGGLFWTLVFNLTQSGWSVGIRRQFENFFGMIPILAVMFLPVVIIELAGLTGENPLCSWLDTTYTQGDAVFEKKAGFFSTPFVLGRVILYFGIWIILVRKLWGYSSVQDRTGDKWLTNKARFTSAWGMLLFALSTAFFAFDWLMALTDYHFFSTMWGVYYFAGAAMSSMALAVIVFTFLTRGGRLRGVVTEEHFHDMGKLMFGFTVFWAYIGFSQYFLIWYANIPEETAFFLIRKTNGWENLFRLLIFGHFVIPFMILLWWKTKRMPIVAAVVAVWLLVMHIADMYWIIRPGLYVTVPIDKVHAEFFWVDLGGILAAVGIYFGLLIRRISSGPLVPLQDPRMPEALQHRNYV